jgi:imidazoleglycerol-phosphate dehydratase
MSKVRRKTRETEIVVAVRSGGGSGGGSVATTEPFLDHMLVTLARYSALDLEVEASGDLPHHLIEDVGITLGAALRDETPDACARYGNAAVPMDDALVQVVLDNGGRPFYEGPLPDRHYDHFFRSLADTAAMTLHITVLRGTDRHHIVEAAFKAFGLALRQAMQTTEVVFSTKGAVELERLED